MAVSLLIAFLIGVALPVLIYAPSSTGAYLIVIGMGLTLIFTSLAFLAAVTARDKTKGIGISLLLWFFFSVMYDGLLIGGMFLFSDYPLETPVLLITMFNPIDLARISVMLKMDISALMGYTGSVYREFFGTSLGMTITLLLMALWAAIPLIAAIHIFKKKNL
jgi:Cu-processing system permease protein